MNPLARFEEYSKKKSFLSFPNIAIPLLFGFIFAYALLVGFYWYYSSDKPTTSLDQFFRYGNYATRFIGGFCVPAFVYFAASVCALTKNDCGDSKIIKWTSRFIVGVPILLVGCSVFLNPPLALALVVTALVLLKGKTPWDMALSYPAAAVVYETLQAWTGNRSWQIFFDLSGFAFFYTSRLYIEQRIQDFNFVISKNPKLWCRIVSVTAITILILLVLVSLVFDWFTYTKTP